MDRKGDWIQTYTGKQFWVIDPRPEDIDILDIAHSLSMMCRWNGHIKKFYSVAEHCIRCSKICSYPFEALLHDGTEAYCSDITRPLKPFLQNYREIENRIADAIATKFNLQTGSAVDEEVKRVDNILLVTEGRDLLSDGCIMDWDKKLRQNNLEVVNPLKKRIKPWKAEKAELEFLKEFHRLSNT